MTDAIAVVDVETTGLFPFRHDRVVEVAVVVVQPDGCTQREFVSLVNPGRDIGPSSIHGLTSEDILYAPQFGEIAALLVEVLTGTVAIASHNIRFDRLFLETEFSRLGHQLPDCFSICTMHLAGGGRLLDCCRDYGVPLPEDGTHHALADARAAARLLACLLGDQPGTVQHLNRLARIEWPTVPRTMKQAVTRDQSRRHQAEPPTFLQRLLDKVHDRAFPDATDEAVMAYEALLDRVLEDRHVDDSEADALVETATRWGLGGDQISLTHRGYLKRLAIAAVADGIVTDAERRDLNLVARLLGQNCDLQEILHESAAKLLETPPDRTSVGPSAETLAGKRVCFTGELQCRLAGEMISREVAEDLAVRAGLVVTQSVTKKLDLLVLADPLTQSGKAKKARRYGVRILHEPVFWKAIGVDVE